MEISVFPRAFSILETEVPQPDGQVTAAHRITVLDAGGTIVNILFGDTDWESFQRFVADPEGEAKRADARAKIAMPPGMAASIKAHPKH